MSGLTPDERAASQQVFERYNPDPNGRQTVKPWTHMTPLRVVRLAFDAIKHRLAAAVRDNFNDYLEVQEDGTRFYYDEPRTQNHPLADGDMITEGGTQEDQDKLDAEIYKLVVGGEPGRAPRHLARHVRNARLMGTYTNLPHGPESIVASRLSGIEKKNAAQQGDILAGRTGIDRKRYSGGRRRTRRGRKSRRKSLRHRK